MTTSAELLSVRKASEEYRESLDKNLRRLQTTISKSTEEFDGLRARIAEVSSELGSEKQRLSSLASDHQAQFSAAQETRNREHAEVQNSRQKDFAELISSFTTKLSEQNADFSKDREALVRQHESNLSKLTQEYEDAAGSLVQDIESHKTQVEKLVGVIGNLGVTSGYLKTADQAARTVMVWQIIAVLAFLSIIGVAGYAFIPLTQGEFTWESFAGRVFVAISVGALAAYAASQVDKYQQIERRTRKLALELEAIGPYLASLPQERQEEFRIKVGERSFGTGADMVDLGSLKSPASVPDLLLKKEFRELFVEIIKAAKR